jgi:hypothetical protein
MTAITNIISYGCSNTGGTELLTHELPEWMQPETVGWERWRERMRTDTQWRQVYKTNREREKQIAWPMIVADKLGMVCENKADEGQSPAEACWKIVRWLEKNGDKQHVIHVIGIGTVNRLLQLNSGADKKLWEGHEPAMFLQSFSIDQRPDLWNYFTEAQLAWTYLKEMRVFRDIKRQLGGRLWLVHTRQPMYIHTDVINGEFYQGEFDRCYADPMWVNKTTEEIYQYCVEPLPGGHVPLETHHKFADLIAPLLQEKINQL